MTTITFPSTPKPQTMMWKLVQPSQNNVSLWTGKRQVLASNRGWWECEITMPPIVGEANARQWLSFSALAAGSANDFRIPVSPTEQASNWPNPSPELLLDFLGGAYYVGDTPSVNGANQTGRSLVTDGWVPSTTILYAGQYVTVNDQLLQLTADITSNAAGQATIQFAPALRASPDDDAPIEFRNPYALMYSVEDFSHSIEPGMVYSMSFSLRESF